MKQILQTYKWNILWAFISCPLTGVARRCEASRGRQQSATMSFAIFLLVNNTFVSRNIVHGAHCHCMPSCVDEGWEREQKMDNGPVMAATVPSLYGVLCVRIATLAHWYFWDITGAANIQRTRDSICRATLLCNQNPFTFNTNFVCM